jgi:hypothetical protein
MIACTICTTTVAIVAGSVGTLALLIKMYWARIRHVFKAKSDTCDCCKHQPAAGDVMTAAKTSDTVVVTEVAEHWVRCRRADGTGFTRSKQGFLKNYRPQKS